MKPEKTLDFELRATRTRPRRPLARSFGVLVAAPLAAVLFASAVGAQTSEPEAVESEAQEVEKEAAEPQISAPKSIKSPSKPPKTFTPTEKIDAESVVSFTPHN
jgi:hypothetical protein